MIIAIKTKVIKKKGTVVKKISLEKANIAMIDAILKDDLVVIEDSALPVKDYSLKVNIYPITYPLEKDRVIGKIEVYYQKKKISQGSEEILESIKKAKIWADTING